MDALQDAHARDPVADATTDGDARPSAPEAGPDGSRLDGGTEDAADALTDAPANDAADAPSDAPVDAPEDTLVDAAEDAPVDAPGDAPADSPRDAVSDAPVDAPVDAPPLGHARIRVANLTDYRSAWGFDFCITHEGSAFPATPYLRGFGASYMSFGQASASEYVTVPAGRTIVRLVERDAHDCSTALVRTPDFTTDDLADGDLATVMVNDAPSSATAMRAIRDSLTAPQDGTMSLRFVNADPGLGSLSLERSAGILAVPLVTELHFGEVSGPANVAAGGPAIDALGYVTLDPTRLYGLRTGSSAYLFRRVGIPHATVFGGRYLTLACPEGALDPSRPHYSACSSLTSSYPAQLTSLRLVNLAPNAPMADLCIRERDETAYLPVPVLHRSGNNSGIGYREASGSISVPADSTLLVRALTAGPANDCTAGTGSLAAAYVDTKNDTAVLQASQGGGPAYLLRSYVSVPAVSSSTPHASIELVHASLTGPASSLWAGPKEVARGVPPLASAAGTSEALGVVHIQIAEIDVVPTGGSDVVLADGTSHSFFWYSPAALQQTADTLVRCRNSATLVDFKSACDAVPR